MNPIAVTDDPRVLLAEEDALLLQEWLLWIGRNPTDDKEVWLLTGLLRSAQRAFRHLRRGGASDASYAAWACRNLFDLRVLTRFILGSVDNRRRFLYDWMLNSAQRSTPEQLQFDPPQVMLPGTLDNEVLLERLWERVQVLTASSGTHLNICALAAQLGLDAELAAVQQATSGRIHPSPRSILGLETDDRQVLLDLVALGSVSLSALVADAATTAISLCEDVADATDLEAAQMGFLPARESMLVALKKESQPRVERESRYSQAV